ncbi:proline iminopeptidase-family hydrolase [Sporolactobacillus nakayamae]|nr:proline iminopeptidase-family hydrolase [Sporolactobacillus nakayamae]
MNEGSHILTINGGYHVWTRKVGDSPIKLLLVHGGPGMTHEYLECFEEQLPPKGIEIYFYDQLGSYFSDQPDDPSLWHIDRFVDELEEVRTKLGLDNFYLLGQSWGGLLAIEYALKYGKALKGLIVSNMIADVQSYVDHVNELREQLPKEIVEKMKAYEANEDFGASEYQEYCMQLYQKCMCRLDPWPDAVNRTFQHLNEQVYLTIQGPNEFIISGNFKDWDRRDDLKKISNPTLLLTATHDSMPPKVIEKMGKEIPNAAVGICENGSHFSMWDDPEPYFKFITNFISQVEANTFNK